MRWPYATLQALALVCAGFGVPASADEVRAALDVPVVYAGLSNGVPHWRIALDPRVIDARIGLLREGDRVELAMQPHGVTRVGLWNQRDRWYSHSTFRKRFLRSTIETRHYGNSDCLIEHRQNPANGALELLIDFVPPVENGQAVRSEQVALGQSVTSRTVDIRGPRWLRIGGMFQTERIRCASLRGQAQGGPTAVRILGSPTPEHWFTLVVTRSSPELEN